jgi:DNA-binding HxlR family transcriptional regulator
VARTVAVIGDRWTLLLLRDCFLGVRRFEAFQRRLGISRTIIADRLSALVEADLLRREPYQDAPVRSEYRLTPKGLLLYPVIVSMAQWGNTQSGMEAQSRLRFHHKSCGSSCKPMLVCDTCGEPLDAREVEVSAGASARAKRPAKPRKRPSRRDNA